MTKDMRLWEFVTGWSISALGFGSGFAVVMFANSDSLAMMTPIAFIIGILGGLVGKILFHEIWGGLKQIMEED